MTADSSTAVITHSGEDGGNGANGVNSPSGRKSLPSPWAQVVRGGIESDLISPSPSPGIAERDPICCDPVGVAKTQPEGSDGGSNCNAGGVVKSAWNKPSANGVVEGVTSPVMGAALWPALSESTKPGVKSLPDSSQCSSKPTTDGSAAVSQAPVISQPLKHLKPTSNSHPNPNNVRQRSFKRGGSTGGASSGNIRPPPPPPLPPMPPPFPVFNTHGSLLPADSQTPQPPFKPNNWAARPVRRNNFGPRPYNNGYGGRREHHGPRSPAARDTHIPMGPPPPPPYSGLIQPLYFLHQPFRPYGAPMGYEMGASYGYAPTPTHLPYLGGAPVPVFPHGASNTPVDSSLQEKILKQVEYYFSDDNLAKDRYLRSHMDVEGWVPITLIAGFRRVQDLTKDTQTLLSSLQDSTTVEIQGGKLRRRTDWRRWIHTPHQVTENSAEEAKLQKLTLENGPTGENQLSE